MGNGKEKLAKDWKRILTQVFKEHPDWKASQIRRQVIVYLGEVKAPGLSSIQKELTAMRARHQQIQRSGLDSPWHLGLLSEYPLPSEAVPNILRVQKWAAKQSDMGDITIREVLWIAHLYALGWKDAEELWKVSFGYAYCELISELSGFPFDTTELDKSLRGETKWSSAIATFIFHKEIEQGFDLKDLTWILTHMRPVKASGKKGKK